MPIYLMTTHSEGYILLIPVINTCLLNYTAPKQKRQSQFYLMVHRGNLAQQKFKIELIR